MPGATDRWLLAIAVAGAAVAVAIAASGGFTLRVGGLRVRAHGWERSAALSCLAIIVLAWRMPGLTRRVLEGSWRITEKRSVQRALVAGACAWTLCAGVAWGTFAIGGSDSYGYAAQARLFAGGRLSDRVVVPPGFTWPGAEAVLVPLGFRPGQTGSEITPSYPPGLPLLMAAAMKTSDRVIYLLVPVFGVLLVWTTWRLGLAMGDGVAGAVAAILLCASPTFLFQLVQPMSDVPAAACWVLALSLAPRRRLAMVAGNGVLASLAVLIRPNLVPLAVLLPVPALLAPHAPAASATNARAPSALLVTTAFMAAFAPALVLLGWIQAARYGSAFASGYGSLEYGFSIQNILPNLARYSRWMTETHTWVVWAALAAPAWTWRRAGDRALAWTAIAFVCVVWASYLPYASFQPDEWSYTRFLLPAIPLMLFFAAATWLWILRGLPAVVRGPALAAGTVALLLALFPVARARGVFRLAEQEAKYPAAAAIVSAQLPAHTFVFAMQHSGSVRYYAGRPIVRWDLLDPERLDEAVAALQAGGFVPCMVVDAAEDADFRARFAAAGQRAVDRRELRGVVGETRIYVFR